MANWGIFDLTGKKALVTGGSGGIGKASAIAMAKAGADVAIIDLKDEMGAETVKQIQALGRKSIYVRCDVSKVEEVDAMVDAVVKAFGRLDIAFNNAGILGEFSSLTDDTAVQNFRKVLEVDLFGVYYCCRAEAKYMIPQKYGRIINTASMSGSIINNLEPFLGDASNAPYCTAKAGVKHLTKALAMELAKHGITVNSISPGYIVTPLTQFVQESPDLLAAENRTTPLHRQGMPEEMAGGVVYLASDASSFTTGHDLVMDGGHTVW